MNGSGQQDWMERESQLTGFAELHPGLGQASQLPFWLYWRQDPCLYLWSFAWKGMVVSSSNTWKQTRSSWKGSLFQGAENAISREASSTTVLWCLSSLIMLVLLKKTTSFSAFAFYPQSMAVQTNLFYRCVRRVFTDKEERYWHLKHYLESVDRSYRNFASFDLLVLWEGFNMNIWRLLEAGLSC